jgi:single-strand DNA-binding protein
MSYSNVENQVQLIGYLGNDPEQLSGGENSYTRFSIATTDSYTNRKGEKVKETTWHSVTFWGKQAENVVKFMKKGSKVLVQGTLKNNKYVDKDGIEKERFYINGSTFLLLDKASNDGQQQPVQNQQQRVPQNQVQSAPAQQPVQNQQQRVAAQPTAAPQQQSAPQPQRNKIQATVPQPQPEPQYTNEDFDLSSDDLPF